MDQGRTGHRRLRLRISTILFVVAITALLVVVIRQQLQIERMRRSPAAEAQQRATLAKIIREQRDQIERHK